MEKIPPVNVELNLVSVLKLSTKSAKIGSIMSTEVCATTIVMAVRRRCLLVNIRR